jgi:protein-S-isoprenylcysteine O-methyltransferase Ste14
MGGFSLTLPPMTSATSASSDAKRGVAKLAFNNRTLLAALPLVYGLVSSRWAWQNRPAVWALASVLCALGAVTRAWSRCHNMYGGGAKKSLATTGPYALVRNPLYVGNVLIFAGAAVASGLMWFVPVVVVWALGVYSLVVRHEDERLVSKYGEEFIRYRARVPAWVPRFPARGVLENRVPIGPLFMSLGAQLAYSCLILLPFIMKELNPLGFWSDA